MLDTKQSPKFEHSVPFFWPLMMFAEMGEEGMALYKRNLDFLQEVTKEEVILEPVWASKNDILYEGDVMRMRDFSDPKVRADKTVVPTLVDAPYAGHTSTIADYAKSQSLIETLQAGGLRRVLVTDWKSATDENKNFDIDSYLARINAYVDDLGGKVNLVGLCQGGWMAGMFAARYPEKAASFVAAGSPLDADAGDGFIKNIAKEQPMSFFEGLVEMGGGLMRGKFMLAGWKAMHPEVHYLKNYVDLYENVEDPEFLKKRDQFARWYEHPLDLPGRWYLQAIEHIFKKNEFCKGEFVALGRKIGLRDIICPTYLLAGASDDITPSAQVFEAEKRLGTPKEKIVKKLVPGGHIGLFMGTKTLKEAWPEVAKWIKEVSPGS
jgi:poly(3-hydroxybutyrate) depolymerase